MLTERASRLAFRARRGSSRMEAPLVSRIVLTILQVSPLDSPLVNPLGSPPGSLPGSLLVSPQDGPQVNPQGSPLVNPLVNPLVSPQGSPQVGPQVSPQVGPQDNLLVSRQGGPLVNPLYNRRVFRRHSRRASPRVNLLSLQVFPLPRLLSIQLCTLAVLTVSVCVIATVASVWAWKRNCRMTGPVPAKVVRTQTRGFSCTFALKLPIKS